MTTEHNQLNSMQSANWFMDIPHLDDVRLKIKDFSIPSVYAGSTNVPNITDKMFYESGDHSYYEDLTITFFVDEDMSNYRKLLRWMKSNTKNAQAETSSLFVHVLNNKRKFQGVEIEFEEAFPVHLGEIDLDTDAHITDVECRITFRYYTFDFVD